MNKYLSIIALVVISMCTTAYAAGESKAVTKDPLDTHDVTGLIDKDLESLIKERHEVYLNKDNKLSKLERQERLDKLDTEISLLKVESGIFEKNLKDYKEKDD